MLLNESWQEVSEGRLAWQLVPPSLLMVTVPLGVPAPGLTIDNAKTTLTDSPTLDGSGRSEVIEIVVFALLTVCAALPEVPGLKFSSPEYTAVRFLTPAVTKARLQEVEGKTAEHELPCPSLIRTEPVGVPEAGGNIPRLK